MKAQLIIEKGQARLLRSIYLKPDAPQHFEVEIPDEAVVESRDWFPEECDKPVAQLVTPVAQPGSLQEELNEILRGLAHVRPGGSIGDDYQMLQEAIEERYAGR